jgi:hypothetical protein
MREGKPLSEGVRWRIVAVAMLAVGAFVLFMSNRVSEKIEKRAAAKLVQAQPALKQIDAAVDALLDRYLIDPKWRKSWRVLTPNRRFIRQERRILVPSEFISLDFNHNLSRALAKLDARVVATERTKESTVTMHVLKDGMIVESISFVLKRGLE